ncbi:MAG: hypothetical protein HGGPFJEG_02383 [Ignavibacteria bacterium]|nr:hypothetical protein [Ignavibacteria bacterium]
MVKCIINKNERSCTLSKQEFLNFAEISKSIPFSSVLDWLNIPYQKNNKELRGDGFIISLEKNLFFDPKDESHSGSVINFVSTHKQIGLRGAASLLKSTFIVKEEHKPKREIPNLLLNNDSYFADRFIKPEVVAEYEAGYVTQRSIVAGRIAFKIYDHEGKHVGYIGYKKEDKSWFFPKGFTRPLYNFHKIQDFKSVIVTTDPFETLRIISMGITQSVSLLAKSMTAEQEEQLKKFRFVLLFHLEPENIVSRLSSFTYIKAPVLSKQLSEYTNQELMNIIKPP